MAIQSYVNVTDICVKQTVLKTGDCVVMSTSVPNMARTNKERP